MENAQVPRHKSRLTSTFGTIASCRPFIGSLGKVDEYLYSLLNEPSEEMRGVSERVYGRAVEIVDKLEAEGSISKDIAKDYDVCVAGGGFLCHYYSGVHSILAELERRGKLILHRFSGASSGAQTPYKILLADDERKAFDIYLAYGQMLEKFRFIGPLTTDYQFRWVIEWMFNKEWKEGDSTEAKLERLNSRMYTALTVLPTFRNLMVSEYPTRKEAVDAYIGTGTFLGTYKGKYVVDGGASNGTPIFKDRKRPQIVCKPASAKLPNKLSHVMGYDLKYAEMAFKLGQDDAQAFIQNPTEKNGPLYHMLL